MNNTKVYCFVVGFAFGGLVYVVLFFLVYPFGAEQNAEEFQISDHEYYTRTWCVVPEEHAEAIFRDYPNDSVIAILDDGRISYAALRNTWMLYTEPQGWRIVGDPILANVIGRD